jgi:hypothetical protein
MLFTLPSCATHHTLQFAVTVTTLHNRRKRILIMSFFFQNAHWWQPSPFLLLWSLVSESLLRTSLHGVGVIGEDFKTEPKRRYSIGLP